MTADLEAHELPHLNGGLPDATHDHNLSSRGQGSNYHGGALQFPNLSLKLKELTQSLPTSPNSAGKILSSILHGLKPEFLSRRTSSTQRQGPTAYLDGLRGCAAFQVCIAHLVSYTHKDSGLCYNHLKWDMTVYNSPTALPVIRILFSGQHFSVVIFFFISGYVLTKRLVGLIHQGRKEEFASSIHSAICRRPGRLFFPVIWTTLTLPFIWHILGINTPWPDHKANFIAEMVNWTKESAKFIFPFREGILFTWYNLHTWTIPVEFRGSMLVYIWLFASSQFQTRTRVLLTLAMILNFVIFVNGVWYSAFLAGLLTVELDLIYAAEERGSIAQLPWDPIVYGLRKRPWLRSLLLHVMFGFALHLASQPFVEYMERDAVMQTCFGWKWLNYWIPEIYGQSALGPWRWFWLFWAGWLMVVSVKEIGWVRRIFESSFPQYLGKHSFALYLCHGPLIGIVSERLFYLTGVKTSTDPKQLAWFGHLQDKWIDLPWWPFPKTGPDSLEPNFLFCVAFSLIFFLYMAELGTKVFDTPSVKFSRRTPAPSAFHTMEDGHLRTMGESNSE